MPAPKDFPDMWAEVKAALAQLRQFMRNPLANTGMSVPGPGVVQVDGQLQGSGFDGDLDANEVGTTGWALSAKKAAMPELLLRPGSIGNDTLTDPVKVQNVRASATNFSLAPATMVEKAGTTVTVPDGFTEANVAAFARMYARNPNATGGADGAGTDALYVRPNVAGNTPVSTPTGVSGSGGFATTDNFDSFSLAGLTPGSTFHIGVEGASAIASIAADPTNYISLVATISWLR